MNHRVLAICVALKQQQFKASSEMAVNNLMQLAASQSKAVDENLQNQRRINEMGQQNIHEFQENNEKIKESTIQNAEYLSNAKEQILEINSDIQRVMEINQMIEQKSIKIEQLANDVELQLQDTSAKIHEQNLEAKEFMERFKYVMKIISALMYTFEQTFRKIISIMEEIGLEVSQNFVIEFLLNLLYFTCTMVFIIFMNLQRKCKYILITLFTFNSVASYYDSDIPLLGTNIFVWVTFVCYHFAAALKEAVHSFWQSLMDYWKFKKVMSSESDGHDEKEKRKKSPSRARSKTPIKNQQKTKLSTNNGNSNKIIKQTKSNYNNSNNNDSDEEENMEIADLCERELQKLDQKMSVPVRCETPTTTIPMRAVTPAFLRVIADTPINSRPGTPYTSGMPGRIQCQGITNQGLQCRKAALLNQTKCEIHNYK